MNSIIEAQQTFFDHNNESYRYLGDIRDERIFESIFKRITIDKKMANEQRFLRHARFFNRNRIFSGFKFPIFKQPWPVVTPCCGSAAWVNAVYEDSSKGGTYICMCCMKPCSNVDWMTVEQYNSQYVSDPLWKVKTEEEFRAMWDPETGPRRV